MERVVIVGGGISGLATAFRLRQEARTRGRDLQVTVLEADTRPGGKMWTERADGFLLEWGPNGFLDSRPSALDMVQRLGIGDSLIRASDKARKRFITRGGRLVRLPETPGAFMTSKLLGFQAKLRVLAEPWAPTAPFGRDETLAEFAARRLGPEARDYLIDPMVSGVFAGNPFRLSLKSAFPRIHELERTYGGLFRGMIGVMRERRRSGVRSSAGPAGPGGVLTSFDGGVATLIETLADRVGDSLLLGTPVTRIQRGGACWMVEARTPDGESRRFPADAVVLSCPAYDAAELLRPTSPGLARRLAAIPYAPIAVVALAFARGDVPHPLDGFGFLHPGKENRPTLGTLWDSSTFPGRAPEGQVLLRTMVGGARAPERAMQSEGALIDSVRRELADILGIKGAPTRVRVFAHANGIPQYETGHSASLDAMARALEDLPGLYLCHNAYRGISMDDCCREAGKTAERVLETLYADSPPG
jgi:oxygen-dependent protoporphyrinogen oxidase